jgi:hypothetical protein
MHLTLLPPEGGLDRVQCSGQIMQYKLPPGPHPLEKLLGPDVFTHRVLFDLEKTTFIDSSGVAWMLACNRQFEGAGGCIVFHSAPPLVDQTLLLLKMDRILKLAANESQARTRVPEAHS